MDALLQVTVYFSLILTLSLLVERFLEVLKTAYDYVDSRRDWCRFWTRQTVALRDKLEVRMRVFEHVRPEVASAALNRFKDMMLEGDQSVASPVPVLSGDCVRAMWIKIASKLVGAAIGVALAFSLRTTDGQFSYGLDLVQFFMTASGAMDGKFTISEWWLRVGLTGIIIGLGSSPVHKVITTIEARQCRSAAEEGK